MGALRTAAIDVRKGTPPTRGGIIGRCERESGLRAARCDAPSQGSDPWCDEVPKRVDPQQDDQHDCHDDEAVLDCILPTTLLTWALAHRGHEQLPCRD